MSENRKLKVFLCHAHADRDSVRVLYSRLKREGVEAWLDKEKLLPGQDWEHEIRKTVHEADVVLVCLSKQFNQAGFRQKEVRLALETEMEKPQGQIFIIPTRLEECSIPENLNKWHAVDLFEKGGFPFLIRALWVRAEDVGATLRNRKRKKVTLPNANDTAPEKNHELSDKRTGLFSNSQFEAYTEVWKSLQELRFVGDKLWELANEKNLRAFAKQLHRTKILARQAELFLEDEDQVELANALNNFEGYSGGKGSLIHLRSDSNIRDFLPESIYVGSSEKEINLAIAKQIKQNYWFKLTYEKVLDKIRVSYRKKLSGS